MGYSIRKRGTNYWLFGHIKRVRLDRSLLTKSKAEAERLAKEIVSLELERAHNIKPMRDISLAGLLDKYRAYCANINKPSTAAKKQFNLNNILSHFGDILVSALDAEMIEGFRTARLAKVTAASVNRDTATLKHLLRLAVDWNYLQASPATHISMLREPKGRTRFLSANEADALIAACPDGVRQLVIVALNTGMRYGELAALEWINADLPNRLIHVADSKNGDSRFIPMNDAVVDALSSLPEETTRVFAGVCGGSYNRTYDAYKSALGRIGIRGFRFHDLRHTFASRLASANVPLSTIATLMGHKNLATTRRYAHLSQSHLRDVVGLLLGKD